MSRYNQIPIVRVRDINLPNGGARYYTTNYYPSIPLSPDDVYLITDFGDRLDKLANQFYSDPSLYWVIASANPDSVQQDSLSLRGGIQLRIPVNLTSILTEYEASNSVGSSLQSTSNIGTTTTTTTNVSPGGGGGGGY
tara:strand:- start:5702 stop:6115 length:414 start_codon:yes stop_codon:yes gene_type:complete